MEGKIKNYKGLVNPCKICKQCSEDIGFYFKIIVEKGDLNAFYRLRDILKNAKRKRAEIEDDVQLIKDICKTCKMPNTISSGGYIDDLIGFTSEVEEDLDEESIDEEFIPHYLQSCFIEEYFEIQKNIDGEKKERVERKIHKKIGQILENIVKKRYYDD